MNNNDQLGSEARRVVAELYFSADLDELEKAKLREALRDAGFTLSVDPIQDGAVIFKRES